MVNRIFLGAAFLLFIISGCNRPSKIETEYGKYTGQTGGTSLNGTRVFTDMFSERGFTVRRKTSITPSIERFSTIVWCPDNGSAPSEEAVERLDQWISEGYDRTLIYVGRDYSCLLDYLNRVKDLVEPAEKEEMLRQIAEAKLEQNSANDNNYFYNADECHWYEKKQNRLQEVTNLRGRLAQNVDVEKTNLSFRITLDKAKESPYRAQTIMKANGQPFVIQLQDDTDMNKILVVSNGSFLLNYSLVNPEHRKIADNLIDEVSEYGDVLFLESGPFGIRVSDSEVANHNMWAWIAEPPLRYIVPHFLFWGILFCFVHFPIFGRPKRLPRKNHATFRSHVNATGKLIAKTKQSDSAISKVKRYLESVARPKPKSSKD